MNIGKNLRIILAATGTSILIAAPAAQAGWCFKKKDRDKPSRPDTPRVEQPRADVCEKARSIDVDALLSRYGHRLSAAQKAQIINAAERLIEAKCGGSVDVPEDPEVPGNSEETPGGDNSGGAPGYGV